MAAEGAVAEAKLFGKWTFDDVEVRGALPTWVEGPLVTVKHLRVDACHCNTLRSLAHPCSVP